MIPAFGLSLIFSILLCVHVVRTNQTMLWLWCSSSSSFSLWAASIYLVAIVLPEFLGGNDRSPHGRRGHQLDARTRIATTGQAKTGPRRQPDRRATAMKLRRRPPAALGRHAEAERPSIATPPRASTPRIRPC